MFNNVWCLHCGTKLVPEPNNSELKNGKNLILQCANPQCRSIQLVTHETKVVEVIAPPLWEIK